MTVAETTQTARSTFHLPQFPDRHKLTHSSEQTFKTCCRKFFLMYRLGLRPKWDSEPLRLGSAVHIGLEVLKNGGIEAEAVNIIRNTYADTECPPYLEPCEFKIEQETAVALVRGYARRYAEDRICKFVAVEVPFEVDIINPETGAKTPIFTSAGKIDAIVELPDGRLAILEHKTTSDSLEIGSDYWRRLLMDSQISRYIMAARQCGYDVQTTVYDVIRKPSIRSKNVTKADRAIATAQGHYFGLKLTGMCPEKETPEMFGARLFADTITRPDFYFARNEVPRLETDLEEFRWEQWAIQKSIHEADKHGRFYRNTGACLSPFKCHFFDICRGLNGDPNEEIPAGFKRANMLHPELATSEKKGTEQ